VRELIYVSERRLHDLHADRPPRWWRRIERSDRAPRWWAEAGLTPGQWVHFEHRLNYGVLDFPGSATVFFWSAGAAAFWGGTAAEASRDIGDPAWLLLHGSPEHVVGHRPPRFSQRDNRCAMPAHGQLPTGDQLLFRVADVLRGLSQVLPTTSAAWMSGYARVTATVRLPPGKRIPDRIVIATPLYVEYVDAPPFPYPREPSTEP
jgi:hypothetical protein